MAVGLCWRFPDLIYRVGRLELFRPVCLWDQEKREGFVGLRALGRLRFRGEYQGLELTTRGFEFLQARILIGFWGSFRSSFHEMHIVCGDRWGGERFIVHSRHHPYCHHHEINFDRF